MNSWEVRRASPASMRVVFRCHGDEFTVKDTIEAGWLRREMEPTWDGLRTALACAQRAEELGLEPDEEALQELSEEFRYKKDLLTAEETEKWLARHDLSEEDFNDFFVRRYWRLNSPGPGQLQPVEASRDSTEFAELLRVELMLSGEFARLARDFSWRVAALYGDAAKRKSKTETDTAGCFDEWCAGAEATYRDVSRRVLTDESRTRMLAAMRIPLTRVVVESVVLKTMSAAREATLCLRDQELTMAELGQHCGSPLVRAELFLSDCEEEQQRRLLCAAPGDVLEPQTGDDGIAVSRLVSKAEPRLDDEAIRAKVDARLLEAHFSQLASETITWATDAERLA